MCSSATRSSLTFKAVPKEGPRAPLFCGIVYCGIATLCLPSLAAGQDAVERSALERCAALDTAIEKLACFESLAESRDVQEAAPVPEVNDAAGRTAEVPEPKDAPPAPASPANEQPAPAPRAGPELGSEHLDREVVEEEEKPEFVSARVKEVWKGGNRLLYFQFMNGQVWRQMESGYFFYPRDREFDVTIRQGMMGDYQMRAEGRGRMTRIVRVK